MKRVIIRSELIDFATLPIVLSISPEQFYKGFEQYLVKPDTKISLDTISNILCQLILNFTEKDVLVLYILYKIVVDGDVSFVSSNFKRKDYALHQVRARTFCLFLFLQTFRTSTAINKKETSGGWANNEGIKSTGQNFSPLNSPRSKAMRASAPDSSQSLMAFVKANLPVMLKLACGIIDFKSKESFRVSPQEFELLNCILSLAEDKDITSYRSLSDLFPKDLDSNSVIALVEKALSTPEVESTFSIHNIRKSVTLKDQTFCKKPILKIHSCEDSCIYINAAVDFVSVTNCVNCTIFIAGVRKVCAVDKCEKLNFTCSSNVIRIGNTIDSHFYTYSTYEPILFGDNKSIFMGPNNANYYEMIDKLKKAEIPITMKSLINFSYPNIFHEYWNIASSPFSIESAKDFSVLVLPDELKPVPSPLSQNLPMLQNMDKSTLVAKCFEQHNTLVIPFLAPQEYKGQDSGEGCEAERDQRESGEGWTDERAVARVD
jgi:hypothetical protein